MAVQIWKIEAIALAAIGDKALAARWLRKPSRLFNGASPLEAIPSSEGRHRVLCQLAWFAGAGFRDTADSNCVAAHRAHSMLDAHIELAVTRAGSGPEEVLVPPTARR
jgi:hypothetical protein